MSGNQENTLPKGFFLKPPRSGSPDWVKGQIGIKVETAIEYLKLHENDSGYVNLDLLESKAGNLYLDLNTYVKPVDAAVPESEPIDDSADPF